MSTKREKMNQTPLKLFLSLALLMSLTVCAETKVDLQQFNFKNAKQPYENIITGGQPSIQDLKALKVLGYTNIVNLRTSGEFDGFDEVTEAKKLGLKYISLEVAGASGITLDNAKKLDAILKELNGNTLVHCASSNRVGALFAVRAAAINGKSIEDALIEGKSAGLKSLYKKAESLLTELAK